jgi:hypothetical protein
MGFWSAVLCGIIAGAGQAYEVDFLDDLAARAYQRRDFRRALALYEEVHQLAPSYRSAFNLAVAAEQAGQSVLAFSLFGTYLALGTDPDQTRREQAEASRARLARGLPLLRVTSNPPDAAIIVDAREVSSFHHTPTTLALETPGRHAVEVRRPGYHPARGELVVERGMGARITFWLAPLFGQVRVDVEPSSAEIVLVDARGALHEIVGGTTATVTVGRHRVRVTAPGFTPEEVDIEVRERTLERRRFALARRPRPTGRVLVSSGAVTGQLFVNGAHRADTPAALDVEAGRHALELRVNGDTVWADEVVVAEGDSIVRLLDPEREE